MGFLNHATNNVIIDAVLTDKGREFLSKNDGSFKISKFRLSDDEVDYSIIEQYGIALGKEKIEKNTPIFEAITNENLALKYPIITLPNDTTRVYAYPEIVINDSISRVSLSTNTESSNNNIEFELKIKTTINQDTDFDLSKSKLVDDYFKVRVFNKLLKVLNPKGKIEAKGDITTYTVSAEALSTSGEFNGQVSGTIRLSALGVTTDSSFNYYSLDTDKTTIKTQVEIIGNRTNAVKVVPIEITSNKLV